jgi:hypothetical protein
MFIGAAIWIFWGWRIAFTKYEPDRFDRAVMGLGLIAVGLFTARYWATY